MDDTLIIYYSYTGTSRKVAQALAESRGWPIGEVLDDSPRSGWLRCVVDSLLRRLPAVRYRGPDPSAYDRVILVSPVWVAHLAAPMRSFVAGNARSIAHYAVVTTMGSGGSDAVEAEIERLLGRPPLLCAEFLARHVDDGTYAAELETFAAAVAGMKGAPPERPPELSPRAA